MKRLILLLFGILFSVLVLAQNKHIVVRGETPASIAKKYSISEEDLIKINPILNKACYVGLEVVIPQSSSSSFTSSADNSILDSISNEYERVSNIWDQADIAFKNKDYKKARNLYSQALKSWDDEADLYYNRGLCNLNLKKYKDSIKDFNSCLNNHPSSDTETQAREMLSKARKLKEQRDAERSELWGGIALVTLGTALAVGSAAIAANNAPQGRPSYYSSSPLGATNLDAIDAYANAEIARTRSQVYANSAMGIAMSRQEQARINQEMQEYTEEAYWKVDRNNPVNKIFFSCMLEYENNPSAYASPYACFLARFEKENGRQPSGKEYDLFQENYGYYCMAKDSSNNPLQSDDILSESSSFPSSGNYLADYRQLEERVKSQFNSWTAIGGSSYKDSQSGDTKIKIDHSNAGGSNLSMFSLIRSNQKQMAEIRHEAARNGVSIPISEWETKQASYR